MGWSVEQVADQLKLAVRQVVALEAGDYASLPSPAVTRGFVRAYAKLMKVDPAPLVAQIEMDTPPAPDNSASVVRRPSPASFSEAKFPLHGKRSKLPLLWIGGAVVVIAAAAAAWHFGMMPSSSSSPDQHAEATLATPAIATTTPDAAGGSAVETLQSPSVPLISVPGPNAGATTTSAAATAPAAGPVVNVPASTATGAPPAAVPAAPATPAVAQGAQTAAGAGVLVLSVREDSWVDVRPARGGAPLISRVVKGGSTETINVAGPVRLVVGNPGGVSATLRGAPVALPGNGKTPIRMNLQ